MRNGVRPFVGLILLTVLWTMTSAADTADILSEAQYEALPAGTSENPDSVALSPEGEITVVPGPALPPVRSELVIDDIDEGLWGIMSPFGEFLRVKMEDTTAFPHRVVGRIATGCTGTLIGPRHVITAGHCVYNVDKKVWYKSVSFSPARNGNAFPFGTVGWKKVLAPQGWTEDADTYQDYALIVLDRSLGKEVGWLAMGILEKIPEQSMQVMGYPADKPLGTMWGSTCPIASASKGALFYRCDTYGGMSGSAIRLDYPKGKSDIIYGVHTNGGTSKNRGARFTPEKIARIKAWMEAYP